MEQNTVGIPQTGAKTAAEIKVTTTDHRTRDFSIGRSRGGEAGSWGHMGPMWPVWPQKGQLCLQRNSDGKEGTWAASLRFLVCIESGGDGTIPTSWDFEGWERAIMRVKVFCKLWNVHFFFFFFKLGMGGLVLISSLKQETTWKLWGHIVFFAMKSDAENISLTFRGHVNCPCWMEYYHPEVKN